VLNILACDNSELPRASHDFFAAAVVGLGTMGAGIAVLLAARGLEVAVADASKDLAAERIGFALARAGPGGSGATRATVDRAAERIHVAADAESAVSGAELVIEAIPEQVDAKLDLLARISPLVPDAVIATNTSSLSIDELSQAVADPSRFLGVHFFNPPEIVPGVEVVRGLATADLTVASMVGLLRRLGKQPAVVRSSPGFIANRLQLALFLEALACVEEGLVSAEDLDTIARTTFGFRLPAYGPLAVADMAGLDVYESILHELERGFGARFAVPERVAELVADGRLGWKTGRGIFEQAMPISDAARVRDDTYARIAEAVAGIAPASGPDADRGAAQ